MAIDPASLQTKPARSIQDIVRDIIQFPISKDPAVAFTSAMRVPHEDKVSDTYLSLMKYMGESAVEDSARDKTSLLDKMTKPLPKKAVHAKPTAEETLGFSGDAMVQYLATLEAIAKDGKASEAHKRAIGRAALPLTELVVQLNDDFAACESDPTMHMIQRELLLEAGKTSNEDVARAQAVAKAQAAEAATRFKATAENLRLGVKPLLVELGAALGVTMNAQIGRS